MKRTIARFALCAGVVAGFGGLASAPALAAAGSATVTSATGITLSSDGTGNAVLNGVVSTGGAPVTWVFQYATDKDYKSCTPTAANQCDKYTDFSDPQSETPDYTATGLGGYIPAGVTTPVTVHALITGLKAGAVKYHFQLLVVQQTSNAAYYPYTTIASQDKTFLTAGFGKVVFPKTRTVSRRTHRSQFSLKCASNITCKGKASLTIHFKRTQIVCYALTFKIKAHKTNIQTPKLRPLCYDRIASIKGKINAVFTVRPTTGQPRFQQAVRLFLVK